MDGWMKESLVSDYSNWNWVTKSEKNGQKKIQSKTKKNFFLFASVSLLLYFSI